MFEEFPKMKFHRTQPPVVVPDAAAEKALGGDWYDTPNIPPDPPVNLPPKHEPPPDLPEPEPDPVPDELMDLQRLPRRKHP